MLKKTPSSILKCMFFIWAVSAMDISVSYGCQEEATLTDQEWGRFREIPGNSWEKEDKGNILHFLLSLEATNTGSEKTNLAVDEFIASPISVSGTRQEKIDRLRELDEKFLTYFKNALEEGRLVQDRVLDKIHPQLKQHFYNEYIKVLEARVANTGDAWKPFYESQKKYEKWFVWTNNHIDEFDIPFEMEDCE
jgi:hypothetical protein